MVHGSWFRVQGSGLRVEGYLDPEGRVEHLGVDVVALHVAHRQLHLREREGDNRLQSQSCEKETTGCEPSHSTPPRQTTNTHTPTHMHTHTHIHTHTHTHSHTYTQTRTHTRPRPLELPVGISLSRVTTSTSALTPVLKAVALHVAHRQLYLVED